MTRVLRMLWAGPWSVVGLLLAPFFDSRRVAGGILLCEGARWPRKLGWRYRAITFGHVVLCVDRADEGLLDHELVHVGQYERWGPVMLPAYAAAALWAKLHGRDPYRDNPFELAARRLPVDPTHHHARRL